jgi:hypothetical protein
MIVEEILRERKPLTKNIRMITNLQNIKNSLKKSHSDHEILSFISSLDFVDNLIYDHLSSLSKPQTPKRSKTKFVARDASNYRKFYKNLDVVKDKYDPFTNFYLKEASFKDYTRNVLPEKIRKSRTKEEKELYQETLDNLLMTEFAQERSQLNVGTHLFKKFDYHFDFDTLITDQNNYDRDQQVYSDDVSDEMFLEQKRVEAEANIIKTKILHKLHEDLPLSENEEKYLKQWNEQVKTCKFSNLNTCMIPSYYSHKSLKDISKSDVSNFNSLPLVNLENLQNYSLNDIVLELNHFIDNKTIQNLQTEIYMEEHKKHWGIAKDFKFTERRNKEIDLVMGELEEKAYRYAGKFNDDELKGMTEMMKCGRGEGVFDQAWVSY